MKGRIAIPIATASIPALRDPECPRPGSGMLPCRVITEPGPMAWEARNMRPWITPTLFLLIANSCLAQWIPQESGTKARLRGLSVVSRDVAWAGGSGGFAGPDAG